MPACNKFVGALPNMQLQFSLGNYILMSSLASFIREHWIVGGVVTSLLWFLAGVQSLRNQKTDAAIFWQVFAVIVILIMCGWAIAEQEWLGIASGIAVFYLETRTIRRILRD